MLGMLKSVVAAVLFAIVTTGSASAQTELLMFDDQGCPYCIQWKAEVGVIYNKTAEGKQAPVTIIDIDDPLPVGVTIEDDPYYTPTFVLLHDGVEKGRIEGYPGEDFFYFMVEKMLRKLPKEDPHS